MERLTNEQITLAFIFDWKCYKDNFRFCHTCSASYVWLEVVEFYQFAETFASVISDCSQLGIRPISLGEFRSICLPQCRDSGITTLFTNLTILAAPAIIRSAWIAFAEHNVKNLNRTAITCLLQKPSSATGWAPDTKNVGDDFAAEGGCPSRTQLHGRNPRNGRCRNVGWQHLADGASQKPGPCCFQDIFRTCIAP